MWKRGEIAPQEQFLLFSTLFYIYISNFRSQITYSFVKCGCSIYVFLSISTLICRGTDTSKYFSESLGIRDNESRLYEHLLKLAKDTEQTEQCGGQVGNTDENTPNPDIESKDNISDAKSSGSELEKNIEDVEKPRLYVDKPLSEMPFGCVYY